MTGATHLFVAFNACMLALAIALGVVFASLFVRNVGRIRTGWLVYFFVCALAAALTVGKTLVIIGQWHTEAAAVVLIETAVILAALLWENAGKTPEHILGIELKKS